MGRWWVKTKGKNCQQKHEKSIFCVEAKSTPPDELVCVCLNGYAVVGRNSRLQSCERIWSSRSAKGCSKAKESGKGNLQSSSLTFFSRKTKSNFLLWKLLRTFFFPQTILFSKHFAWSVLSLVVFKTSISCAMPCWTVLPLRRLEDDFASAQRNDASCLCWHFLSSCLYSPPCHESSCRNLFVLLFLREPNSCAFNGGECCRCDQCSFFPYA